MLFFHSVFVLQRKGSLKTVFDDCISSALFRIFAGEYSGISLIKPNDENEKPYVLTKSAEKVSSWNQDDILQFCQSEIGEKNYEIVMDEERKFVCQISNVLDKNSVKKLYLKCFPEFEFKKKEITNDVSDEISLLSRYFREKLNEL